MKDAASSAKIGSLLVKLRKAKGLTEKALAQRIGMTDAYINLIENDKRNPSLSTLNKLANSLGISVDVFLSSAVFLSGAEMVKPFMRTIPLHSLKYFSSYSKDTDKTISVVWDTNDGDFAALQMDDDSMAPAFLPGDVVVIDKSYSCSTNRKTGSADLLKKISSGNYVVCNVTKERSNQYGYQSMLRCIEINEKGKSVTLDPLNSKAYERLVLNVRADHYNENNMDIVNVMGKVVSKIEYKVVPLPG